MFNKFALGMLVLAIACSSPPVPTITPLPTFMPKAAPMASITPVWTGLLEGVTISSVNVRLGPGIKYPIVAKLGKDAQITVRGRDAESRWFYLNPPPSGWLSADFVSLSGDSKNLPIVSVIELPSAPPPTATMSSATATPTIRPIYVDFRVDTPWIVAGQCTTLRWDVEGVRAVYLDGQGKVGHGSQEVCPEQTRIYVLRVILGSGYLDRVVAVSVISVPPTATP